MLCWGKNIAASLFLYQKHFTMHIVLFKLIFLDSHRGRNQKIDFKTLLVVPQLLIIVYVVHISDIRFLKDHIISAAKDHIVV